MQIHGVIREIYETWPLQLSLDVAGKSFYVALNSDTVVTQGGVRCEASQLRGGDRVTVQGDSSGETALIARGVDILTATPPLN